MRKIINHVEGQTCEWCSGIKVNEECIQSEAFGNRKWHEDCEPQARAYRFGKDMKKPYTKEILKQENEG